ncbi:uroporphyrinogen-III synthase [Phenylobacterium sp. LH3H17]|uniref:uroporphyrinogen-III synthase n=1 Tax=Phenylobacterium sp. LH3H17 TaxID=2903901 RepID=UPI0020C98EFA|nr:uroporphyrinogen-III synthase [Phenylobacterium sp. LH3H17]UTP39568.1 uroporphyrinogen-III synthase [Phenylobacterium sp. LH3H17]
MSKTPRRIWITRAQPGAAATAARVRDMGHEAFVAPLLEMRTLPDAVIDLEGVGSLAFTSSNGVRAFAELTKDRSLRVFAVGQATAQAAKAVGFKRVLSADGDVAALAEGIAVRRAELTGAVLHPGAAELAGDLAGVLARNGIEARQAVLYDTVAATLDEKTLAALPGLDTALVHSPKAAEALAALLRAQPLPQLRVLCLSKAVMKPLARAKVAARVFSPFPLEAALLNLIDR